MWIAVVEGTSVLLLLASCPPGGSTYSRGGGLSVPSTGRGQALMLVSRVLMSISQSHSRGQWGFSSGEGESGSWWEGRTLSISLLPRLHRKGCFRRSSMAPGARVGGLLCPRACTHRAAGKSLLSFQDDATLLSEVVVPVLTLGCRVRELPLTRACQHSPGLGTSGHLTVAGWRCPDCWRGGRLHKCYWPICFPFP